MPIGVSLQTVTARHVVVSNHQSNLDPMAYLRALPLSLRVLAMHELFRIPLLGRAMRKAGMIEVDRDSPRLPPDRPGCRPVFGGRALAAGLPGGHGLTGWHDRRLQRRRLHHRGYLPGAGPAGCHPWHRPDLAAGAARPPRRPGACRHRTPLPTSRLSHHDVAGLREQARDVIWTARRDLVEAMSAKAVS